MGHGSQFLKKILIIYIVANLIVMALKAFTPLGQNSIFNLLAFVILSIFTVYWARNYNFKINDIFIR